MKNIEKVAIVLIVLWVITLVTNPLFRILTLMSVIPQEYAGLSFYKSTLALSTAILGMIVHIGVAIWLFGLAKRGEETP